MLKCIGSLRVPSTCLSDLLPLFVLSLSCTVIFFGRPCPDCLTSGNQGTVLTLCSMTIRSRLTVQTRNSGSLRVWTLWIIALYLSNSVQNPFKCHSSGQLRRQNACGRGCPRSTLPAEYQSLCPKSPRENKVERRHNGTRTRPCGSFSELFI